MATRSERGSDIDYPVSPSFDPDRKRVPDRSRGQKPITKRTPDERTISDVYKDLERLTGFRPGEKKPSEEQRPKKSE